MGGGVFSGTEYSRTVNNSKLIISSGTSGLNGGSIELYGKDHTTLAGFVSLKAQNSSNYSQMIIQPSGTFTFNNNGTTKNLAMQEDVIPRSGGAVMSGYLYTTTNTSAFVMGGGSAWDSGGSIELYGREWATEQYRGMVRLQPAKNYITYKHMELFPDGTWTWEGTAVQLVSDQRLKQQISEIDDKLLDAWKDVDLVQFKYNDAVNEKGNQARLHTGYVVQQINEACQKHNIDISEYGLYCHEEYPERTEEVTITNEDGTTSKETKVIEEASEHYSLRYTETLVVECAYLRRENARLKERLQQHDDYFSNIEKRLQSLENS